MHNNVQQRMLKECCKKSGIRNDSKQTNGPQSSRHQRTTFLHFPHVWSPHTIHRPWRTWRIWCPKNISSLDAVKRAQVDVVPVQTWAWQGSLLNVWLEVQRHVVFILWHFRLPVFLLWHCAMVLRMAYPRRGGSVTTTIHYSIYCMLSALTDIVLRCCHSPHVSFSVKLALLTCMNFSYSCLWRCNRFLFLRLRFCLVREVLVQNGWKREGNARITYGYFASLSTNHIAMDCYGCYSLQTSFCEDRKQDPLKP